MSLLLLLASFLAGDEWRFELSQPEGHYVVFFTAKWCGPCQRFKANGLAALQAAYPVKIVDIDEEPRWKAQVDRYPTFWLCRRSDQTRIAKWTGNVTAEQIRQAITKATEQAETKPTEPGLSSAPEWHVIPQSVVALEGPSSRWSGVVISPDTILTCAHHGETAGITATVDGRRIGCAVIRSDARLDLSVLRLSEPLPVAFGAMLGRDSEPAYLAGYLRGTDPQLLPVQRRDGIARINGVRVLPLVSRSPRPDSISGMSGGPVLDSAGRVVGVLRCADKTTADAARIEEIREFLR
jgi:hypothetical protein